MTKTVFQTDLDGVFLYATQAHELALASGSFNIPYGAYEVAPPAVSAGMCARWNSDRWEIVPDYRQASLWIIDSGEPYHPSAEVKLNGEARSYPGWGDLPPWLTAEPPAPSPHLQS